MIRTRLRLVIPLAAVSLVLAACSGDDGGGAATPDPTEEAEEDDDGDDDQPVSTGEFPRHETLYTTGTEWGTYSNWNPLAGGGQATGTRGLIYETLFLFDPRSVSLEPWLAESGEWVSDDEYVIHLRDGVTWQDGEPFTADDVVFTLDLREFSDVKFSNLAEWVESATAVDDQTVSVTFSHPRKGQWDNFLYSGQIVAEHLWADKAEEGITQNEGLDVVVGTGAYKYNSHTEDRAVLERNDDWWGTAALGLEMTPRYIIDFKNQSNEVVIPQLAQAEIDISNNFMPVNVVSDNDQIEAYNDEPPYMIGFNTAYLLPNHTLPPMDDAAFRRALAFSIDVDDIVNSAYAGLVTASNPTGLLPPWVDAGMVDESVVAEHGFSHDPAEAAQILADAGYTDQNGDGFVQMPNGDPIELSLITPTGWTDWNVAAEIITENAQAAGINVTAEFPDSETVDEMRNQGEFELVLNNWTELQNTPYDTYEYLYRLPVLDLQGSKNFHRAENPDAWALASQLGALSVGDPGFNELMSQLQEIMLTELPAIPLWYNGLWSQWNTTYWTDWPKGPDGPYPSTWNGAWEKSAIYMLAQIQPTGAS